MKEKLLKLLKAHEPKLAAVATATAKGRPAIAVCAYAVRDDDTIVISTHQSSHKWENLKGNPEIGLVVGWQFDQAHLQLGGDAVLLTGDKASEIEEFFFKANPQAAAFKTPDTGFVIIIPTWARITTFRQDAPPETTEGKL